MLEMWLSKIFILLKKILVIIEQFSGAFDFYIKVKELDELWDEIIYTDSRKDIFVKYKNEISYLLTNSDLGKEEYLIKYILKPKNCYVYEEGAGSYLSSGLTFQPLKKRLIYRILQFNCQYGNSKLTKGMYLYYPSVHFSTKGHVIEKSFESYVKENIKFF
ncbi:hypothetical protein [Photobacterium damselae]|uniref:hypothetical protein n=1 Tax=Photobacterium damselae TaxID=38293 RepID=UPI001F30C811|nr:hypothetical protein [Photobacterium damselae]UKA02548.1 hypothetical protein IHC89_04300 [Photobacterium damselae subsp. damselae]